MKHEIVDQATAAKPQYERPEIQVMNEAELLSAIQINAGATSWWVM